MPSSRPVARSLFAALLCAVCAVGLAAERDAREKPRQSTTKTKDAHEVLMAIGAPEDTTIEVDVGGRPIVVPIPKGYLRLSEAWPEFHAFFDKIAPAGSRSVECLKRATDLALDISDLSGDVQFELYAVRRYETRQIPLEEWESLAADMKRLMATMDVQAFVEDREAAVNKAIEELSPGTLRTDIQRVDRPTMYRQDARALRYLIVLPNRQEMSGKFIDAEEVRVAAMVRVQDRMLVVVAAKEFEAGKADVEAVKRRLDAHVDAMLRLNPLIEPQPSKARLQ